MHLNPFSIDFKQTNEALYRRMLKDAEFQERNRVYSEKAMFVLQGLADGKTLKELAALTGENLRTMETFVCRLMAVNLCPTRTNLVALALREGVIK